VKVPGIKPNRASFFRVSFKMTKVKVFLKKGEAKKKHRTLSVTKELISEKSGNAHG